MIKDNKEFLLKFGIIFVFIAGILLRLFVYFKNLSFGHDDACLALNVMLNSYYELFKGLDYMQVAPPMFLVCSKFFYQIFKPDSDSARDLIFRLIPLVSGIAAIPLFYYFVNLITKNKLVIWISFFIFTFNTFTIMYCAQFKQYSLELLVSLILFVVFYKIIFCNDYKWYYSFIIAVSVWFSLSSLFVIGSYFFYYII